VLAVLELAAGGREREEKGLCTKRGDRKLELDSGWFKN
jgi:hypothetical protein